MKKIITYLAALMCMLSSYITATAASSKTSTTPVNHPGTTITKHTKWKASLKGKPVTKKWKNTYPKKVSNTAPAKTIPSTTASAPKPATKKTK